MGIMQTPSSVGSLQPTERDLNRLNARVEQRREFVTKVALPVTVGLTLLLVLLAAGSPEYLSGYLQLESLVMGGLMLSALHATVASHRDAAGLGVRLPLAPPLPRFITAVKRRIDEVRSGHR